jgi:hypothetical protein
MSSGYLKLQNLDRDNGAGRFRDKKNCRKAAKSGLIVYGNVFKDGIEP